MGRSGGRSSFIMYCIVPGDTRNGYSGRSRGSKSTTERCWRLPACSPVLFRIFSVLCCILWVNESEERKRQRYKGKDRRGETCLDRPESYAPALATGFPSPDFWLPAPSSTTRLPTQNREAPFYPCGSGASIHRAIKITGLTARGKDQSRSPFSLILKNLGKYKLARGGTRSTRKCSLFKLIPTFSRLSRLSQRRGNDKSEWNLETDDPERGTSPRIQPATGRFGR